MPILDEGSKRSEEKIGSTTAAQMEGLCIQTTWNSLQIFEYENIINPRVWWIFRMNAMWCTAFRAAQHFNLASAKTDSLVREPPNFVTHRLGSAPGTTLGGWNTTRDEAQPDNACSFAWIIKCVLSVLDYLDPEADSDLPCFSIIGFQG